MKNIFLKVGKVKWKEMKIKEEYYGKNFRGLKKKLKQGNAEDLLSLKQKKNKTKQSLS